MQPLLDEMIAAPRGFGFATARRGNAPDRLLKLFATPAHPSEMDG
jgi:hypothetical protein